MLERGDYTFAAALERFILLVLNGDGISKNGLYQSIMAVPNWDEYIRTKASIIAYQVVLNEMQEIRKRMNEGEEPSRPQPPQQPRVN